MNIIISTDSLRHSLTINLRGWRTPVALLAVAALGAVAVHSLALNLARGWASQGAPEIQELVDQARARNDAERVELWNSTVDRLNHEVSGLQVRIWRTAELGNKIAEHVGLGEEVLIKQESIPVVGVQDDDAGPNDRISLLQTQLFSLQDSIETEYFRLSRIGENTAFAAMQRSTVPMRRPIEGRYWQTSGFGSRKDPFTGRRAFHAGYDFAARTGTPVLAAADGIVTHRGRLGNYGKLIEVYHGQQISTMYGHLSDYRVESGQFVTRGDVIGLVGSTGRSTGPHLHYEVRLDGRPQPYSKIIKQLLAERPLVALAPPADIE